MIRITNVSRLVYPDGALEFGVTIKDPVDRFRIDYGDGFHEETKLKHSKFPITIYGEHRYKPGVYRATIYLQLNNTVVERRVLMVTQN